MAYQSVERNFDNIQFANLRKSVDPQYNDFHDELSSAYYNGTVFKHPWLKQWGYPKEIDFGALKISNPVEARALFEEIHGLQDWERQKKFHDENIKLPEADRIPEEKYNIIYDVNGKAVGKKSDEVLAKINTLRTNKGFELVVG